jgi:hypothetical protein
MISYGKQPCLLAELSDDDVISRTSHILRWPSFGCTKTHMSRNVAHNHECHEHFHGLSFAHGPVLVRGKFGEKLVYPRHAISLADIAGAGARASMSSWRC